MPNVLAMSFEGELSPSFHLVCLEPGHRPPDGWGLGHFPRGEPSASVWKEPAPGTASLRAQLVANENLESSVFVMHVRSATWGALTDANTQPFCRSHGARDFLFAHSGSLRYHVAPPPGAAFEPVGSTDSELIFCVLLGRMHEAGARGLGDVAPERLREWLDELNAYGSLSNVISDGRDLAIYADREGEGELWVWELTPPYGQLAFGDAEVEVNLTKRDVKSRKGVIVSSSPLDATGGTAKWRRLEPGALLVVRQGAIRAELKPVPAARHATVRPESGLVARAIREHPRVQPPKRLEVQHSTVYTYDKPVERSMHLFRLVPVHDRLQSLLEHELAITLDKKPFTGRSQRFEDVFGNQTLRIFIETAFTELRIEARSVALALDGDPMGNPAHKRSQIPLVWMPWQRQALQPFLLPPELPETQLAELTEYAMSFVERNDYDLLDTLVDINATIFKEYRYQQGSTSLSTTAFETYCNRRGVCQDFTNLFICLARLLGVPARYVCGYLYTGPKNPNQVQSEASHAWLQVYLPESGWKGFDPTNGIVTQTDHIRVAVGRNYVDATPTSGTIYVGGGAETLEVKVHVDVQD